MAKKLILGPIFARLAQILPPTPHCKKKKKKKKKIAGFISTSS